MKFQNTRVFNFEGAFRGMRNPLNSWDKSDSIFAIEDPISPSFCDDVASVTRSYPEEDEYKEVELTNESTKSFVSSEHSFEYNLIGAKDMELAKKLIKGGSEHRKFLRQIFVSVDITAPLYIWKEVDTYKIGTTANSTSTMHTLAKTPITKKMFEIDDYVSLIKENKDSFCYIDIDFNVEKHIAFLEALRRKYLETQDKRYWKELIRWLPESWLQTRTWTANYEILRNIYHQRKNHKLTEWHSFIKWIEEEIPYAKDLILN